MLLKNFRILRLIAVLLISISSELYAAPSDHFVTTWDANLGLGTNAGRIIIGTEGTGYNYNIDANNDGVFELTGLTGDTTLVLSPGNHTIRISGDFPRISLGDEDNTLKLVSIDQWGSNKWTDFTLAFAEARNLVVNAQDTPDLSMCQSLSHMFADAPNIGLGNANWDWDTFSITSMSGMFAYATTFDADIGSWTIYNVSNFTNMLLATSLSQNNYDALLTGWTNQPLVPNQTFHAGSTKYCSVEAQAAHAAIIANYNWTITDQGLDPDCDTSIASNHFVITVDTTIAGSSNSSSFTIPTSGTGYNYNIDSNNNGTFNSNGNTGGTTINFGSSASGIKTIRIAGDFPRIYFNESGDKDKILSIEQWGTTRWKTMNNAFSGASNLVINATDTPNLSNVLSMFSMFKNTNNIGNGTGNWNWGTSNIAGMANLFQNAVSFDQDISSWNVANVDNFGGMFSGATLSYVNYDALLISWDAQSLSPNESFNGGNSIYCLQAAQDARASIIANDGWTINDGGICSNQIPVITSSAIVDVVENQTSVITVTATDPENDNITFSISGADADKLTINTNTGVLVFNTAPDFENPISSLGTNTYIVEITATDNGSPQTSTVQTLTISVTDVLDISPSDYFITTWETTAGDTVITIPTFPNATYNYDIDWNNDSVIDETGITGNATHNYGSAGIHTVRIVGIFPRIFINEGTEKDKIRSIEQWGTTAWTSMANAFSGATYVINNAQDTPDLSGVSSLFKMFANASKIGGIGTGSWLWNTGNITGMAQMFLNAGSFDKDISFWSVILVSNFNNMFLGATLSSANYDALLISWRSHYLSPDIVFNGGNSKYCSPEAQDARARIIDISFWTITDGGLCNQAPTVTSSNTANAAENQTSVITITATDPESDTVTYSITGADMDKLTVDTNTGVLVFNTAPDFENPSSSLGTNTYVVDITATDNGTPSQIDTQTLSITVTNANESPTITSPNAVSVPEDQLSVSTVTVTDPESTAFSYSISGADAALFSIFSSATIRFNSPPDFENPSSTLGTNTYIVDVTVTDNGTPALSDTQTLSITVTNVNEYPTITSSNSVNTPENQTHVITVTTIDPESGTINYSISGGVDAALFVIDANTGDLAFISAPDFENPTGNNNLYRVDITATDNGTPNLDDTQSILITVTDVIENLPPTIDSPLTISTPENQLSVATITATDPESDTVTFTITGGTDANLFDLNITTGGLTFKLAPDYEIPNSSFLSNTYLVEITATDDGSPIESSAQTLTINVSDVADYGPSEVFVTTWKTDNPGTSNNTSITIPTVNNVTYAYNVDWNGDGDFDDQDENIVYTGDATHDFTVAGTYTIKIGGLFPSIYFLNAGDREKILSIDQWGTNQWTGFVSAFNGAINLVNNAPDTPDLSQVTSLNNTFSGATSIGASTESGNWNWDTSTIIYLTNVFRGATSFDQDLSGWDISQVTDLSFMFVFGGGDSLSYQNYDALLISWSVQAVNSNMIFHGGNAEYCSLAAQNARNHLINNLNWSIADGGLNASLCANQAIQITSLPFANVLENQTSVTTLTVLNPNATTLSFSISGGNDMNLFSISSTGVVTFNNPPDFENPTSASGTNDYFVEITVSDNSIPVQSDTQLLKVSVQDVIEFNSNELFVTTWKTDNPGLTNDSSIRIYASTLDNNFYRVDWNGDGDFDDFEEDINYTGIATHDYGVAGTYTIKIFGDFPAINMQLNQDREKLISIDQWGSNQWRSLTYAFDGAINVVNNAIDTPDLSLVSDISLMFSDATSIGNGNANWNWDTSTITDMSQLFTDATSFNENLSSWNIENVTNMELAFRNVPLSTANYDAMLIAWNAQNLQPNILFNADISQYCSTDAVLARQNMIDTHGWFFTDNGIDPACALPEIIFTNGFEDLIVIKTSQEQTTYDFSKIIIDDLSKLPKLIISGLSPNAKENMQIHIRNDLGVVQIRIRHKLKEQWQNSQWQDINNLVLTTLYWEE